MAMKKADKVEQTEYDSAREGWKRVNPDLARETENQERSQASQQERAQVRFFPQGSGYTVGILFGFFLVSKEFLVFNEETLVAVAFTLFVFLGVTKLGGTVREELDSKSQQIDEEYARSQRLEEDYVKHLISFYERQETAGKDILDFSEYVQGSLQGMFTARERQYEAEVWGQVVARLKRIRDLERRSTEAFQKTFVNAFVAKASQFSKGTVTGKDVEQLEELFQAFSSNLPVWKVNQRPKKKGNGNWKPRVKPATVKFQMLGKVSDLPKEVYQDSSMQLEFYRDGDFYRNA